MRTMKTHAFSPLFFSNLHAGDHVENEVVREELVSKEQALEQIHEL